MSRMMADRLVIEYPETLPESREQFEQEARTAMAVKLFEMKRLSSGMAAQLAGLDRVSFLLRLHQFGVAMVNLNDEEVIQDIQNV